MGAEEYVARDGDGEWVIYDKCIMGYLFSAPLCYAVQYYAMMELPLPCCALLCNTMPCCAACALLYYEMPC